MKATIAALAVLFPLAAGSVQGACTDAPPRAVRFHLTSGQPWQNLPDLLRAAQALQRVDGVDHVDVSAADGDVRVTLRDGATIATPDLVRAVEAQGFHATEEPAAPTRLSASRDPGR